jgi:hypothetical protein
MSKIEQTGKVIADKADTFLSGKPIWFWWAGYILLTATLFAVFYLVFYVLTVQWWIVALLIVVIGFIWGTIAFTNRKSAKK